jgi:ribosomal protein L17
MQMFRDNGKKIDLGEILNFYAVEPVKMTHYHYGRLSIPQVKTTEMHDLMYVMLAQSNTENLDELTRKLVHASALSIQAEVKKAKEGKAFLSHLMTLTAANMMGNSEKAGAYMRIMESIFIRFHPQIKRLFKAELLASNGVRSDQVKGLRGFTTVRSLADDGITVGYIPGINGDPSRFFIRATGKFNDYTDYYAQQLERYLHILKRYRMQ